jgi:hippurate hydrolase
MSHPVGFFRAASCGPTAFALIAAFVPSVSHAQTAGSVPAQVRAAVARELPELGALYRTLHAAPELSLREEHTSARVVREPRKTGFMLRERVGGWGLAAKAAAVLDLLAPPARS